MSILLLTTVTHNLKQVNNVVIICCDGNIFIPSLCLCLFWLFVIDYSRNYFPVFEPRQATNNVGTLGAEGRARLITVFDPQHTHLPPRGVMFDDDFMTTSEFVQRVAELKNQHCAFVDAFARALRKMKDAEKAMLGEEDKCSLCDRMDLSGYQCITCHQWVCEFCFPQVMRSEVRTTVVVEQDGVEEIHLKCPFCRDMFHEAIGPSPRNFDA